MEVKCRHLMSGEGLVWHKNGSEMYYHREDGPAVVHFNGIEYWWYYDTKYVNPEKMPLNLFLAYVKWEYKKKHGS
jgi:hypothetical protein